MRVCIGKFPFAKGIFCQKERGHRSDAMRLAATAAIV